MPSRFVRPTVLHKWPISLVLFLIDAEFCENKSALLLSYPFSQQQAWTPALGLNITWPVLPKKQKKCPRESPLNKVSVYYPFGYTNSVGRITDYHDWICLGILVEKVRPFCECLTCTLALETVSSQSTSTNHSRKWLATQCWFWASRRTLGSLSPTTLSNGMEWSSFFVPLTVGIRRIQLKEWLKSVALNWEVISIWYRCLAG